MGIGPRRRTALQRWLDQQRYVVHADREPRNQGWLARKAGVDRSTICRIALGRRTPSLQLAADLEKLTGISASQFAA